MLHRAFVRLRCVLETTPVRSSHVRQVPPPVPVPKRLVKAEWETLLLQAARRTKGRHHVVRDPATPDASLSLRSRSRALRSERSSRFAAPYLLRRAQPLSATAGGRVWHHQAVPMRRHQDIARQAREASRPRRQRGELSGKTRRQSGLHKDESGSNENSSLRMPVLQLLGH